MTNLALYSSEVYVEDCVTIKEPGCGDPHLGEGVHQNDGLSLQG